MVISDHKYSWSDCLYEYQWSEMAMGFLLLRTTQFTVPAWWDVVCFIFGNSSYSHNLYLLNSICWISDQFILEDLLEDIAFFIKYPEFSTDYALVYVIFSDYMRRKFVSRELHPGEITYPEVSEVEQCIVECKVGYGRALVIKYSGGCHAIFFSQVYSL